MPRNNNLPNTGLSKLGDYFYYVLLLSFLALPFFASFKLLQQSPTVYVAEPSDVTFTLESHENGNTFVPGEAKRFNLVVNSDVDTEVDIIGTTVKIPENSGLQVTTPLPRSIISDPEPAIKLVEARAENNDIYYDVVLVAQQDNPATANLDDRTPLVLKTGKNIVASFHVTAQNEGTYTVSMDSNFGVVGLGPSGEGTDATASVNYLDTSSLSNTLVLTAASSGTPTPTPTVAVPTPTPTTGAPTPTVGSPTPTPTTGAPTPTVAVPTPTPTVPPVGGVNEVDGLVGDIELGLRVTDPTVKGFGRANAQPVVFVGVWRPDTNTMLVAGVVQTNTDGSLQNKGNVNLVSMFSTINANAATQLKDTDVLVVKPESYLAKTYELSELTISGANLVVSDPVRYTPGDPVVDLGTFDVVNIRDYAFARSYINNTRNLTYDTYFLDFNGDGVVTGNDMAAYNANYFGQVGGTAEYGIELASEVERVIRNSLYEVIEK
jgi:hypothetical protein